MKQGVSRESYPLLVGDVGGTHSRFAVVPGPGAAAGGFRTLKCRDYAGLAEAIGAYLAQCEGPRPLAAAVAVATPVYDDQVTLTNHDWSFSVAATARELGLERLLVLNDFTALAMALPLLGVEEAYRVGGGQRHPASPIALIGPGTGLGVSGLIPAGDSWVPLQTEGGHVTLSPADRRQMEILARVGEEYGHVSAERLISGPGLVLLYRTIAALAGDTPAALTPAQITRRAEKGDCVHCEEAVAQFCSMLGTVAGNLALSLGARGGVYIGGGIVPKLGTSFAHSGFREAFEHKGRFQRYMAAIPTHVIMAPYAALMGAAQAYASPLPHIGVEAAG